MCRSTRTMPSARLNDAPVGQTSTHGGSAQCWHITGSDWLKPVAGSWISTFLIHWASVAGLPWPCSPFSSMQARTHSSHPLPQRLRSISIPHRTSPETATSSSRAIVSFAIACFDVPMPYRKTPGASVTPAAAATVPRNLRRPGSKRGVAAIFPFSGFRFIFIRPQLRRARVAMHGTGNSRCSLQHNRGTSGKNVPGWLP